MVLLLCILISADFFGNDCLGENLAANDCMEKVKESAIGNKKGDMGLKLGP